VSSARPLETLIKPLPVRTIWSWFGLTTTPVRSAVRRPMVVMVAPLSTRNLTRSPFRRPSIQK